MRHDEPALRRVERCLERNLSDLGASLRHRVFIRIFKAERELDVFPFRLTEENLRRHDDAPWNEFWRGLAPICDAFEQRRVPPKLRISSEGYRL